jgi:hypothetical protein
VTKPRPLGNRAAELVDIAIQHTRHAQRLAHDARAKQDRHPDLAAQMVRDAEAQMTRVENLLMRVRYGDFDED